MRKFVLLVAVVAAVGLGIGAAASAYTQPYMGFASGLFSTDEDSGVLWVKIKQSPKEAFQHGLFWTADWTANGANNCGLHNGVNDYIQIPQDEARLITLDHRKSVWTPVFTCSDPVGEANPEYLQLLWQVVQIVGQPTSHNGRTFAWGALYD